MESKDYNILKGMMKYLGLNRDDLTKLNSALSFIMPISYPVTIDEDDKINSHEEAADMFEGVGEYIMDRSELDRVEIPPSYNIIHTNNGPKMLVTIADELTILIQMLSAHDARALSSSLFGDNFYITKTFRLEEWPGFALLKKGEEDSVYISRHFGNESRLGLISNINSTWENEDSDTWKKLDGVYWNDIIK